MKNLKDNPLVPQAETPGVDGEYIGRDDSNKILEGKWIEAPVTEIVRGCVDSESVIVIHGELGNKVSFTKDRAKFLIINLSLFAYPPDFSALKISTDGKD